DLPGASQRRFVSHVDRPRSVAGPNGALADPAACEFGDERCSSMTHGGPTIFRQASPGCISRDLVGDVFWYGLTRDRGWAFAGRRSSYSRPGRELARSAARCWRKIRSYGGLKLLEVRQTAPGGASLCPAVG